MVLSGVGGGLPFPSLPHPGNKCQLINFCTSSPHIFFFAHLDLPITYPELVILIITYPELVILIVMVICTWDVRLCPCVSSTHSFGIFFFFMFKIPSPQWSFSSSCFSISSSSSSCVPSPLLPPLPCLSPIFSVSESLTMRREFVYFSLSQVHVVSLLVGFQNSWAVMDHKNSALSGWARIPGCHEVILGKLFSLEDTFGINANYFCLF